MARAMCGSACARIPEGKADGSLPNRMFGPMLKSSATCPLAAFSVMVAPFAVVSMRGGRTRLSSRFSNISAPEDIRSSGRLRRFGGSFDRSAGGLIGSCPCWAHATEFVSKSKETKRDLFNIKTLAILLKYNNRLVDLLRYHPRSPHPVVVSELETDGAAMYSSASTIPWRDTLLRVRGRAEARPSAYNSLQRCLRLK